MPESAVPTTEGGQIMATSDGETDREDPSKTKTAQSKGPSSSALPKVDFSSFVLSLGTTALYQLGIMPDPSTGERTAVDTLIAQQTIDTLEMLSEKTRGNLDDEERKLIESLLYELRMRFVEVSR
jgi:hypothetical protein